MEGLVITQLHSHFKRIILDVLPARTLIGSCRSVVYLHRVSNLPTSPDMVSNKLDSPSSLIFSRFLKLRFISWVADVLRWPYYYCSFA